MTPFPKSALPVLKIIRKEVKRPKKMPEPIDEDGIKPMLRWRIGKEYVCPMGLCSKSLSKRPFFDEDFNYYVPSKSVSSFATWFDSQTDARAVMDFIWPKKGKR